MAAEMVNTVEDIPLFLENATVTMLSLTVVVKFSTFLFRRQRIRNLLHQMSLCEDRIFRSKQKHTVIIFDKAMQQGWNFTKAYCGLFLFTLIGVIGDPLAQYYLTGPEGKYNYKPKHLYLAWFPFDSYSAVNYVFVYIFQVSIGFGGGYALAAIDAFFISLMIFASGQFRILQHWIEVLDEENISWDVVKDIVDHHCDIME